MLASLCFFKKHGEKFGSYKFYSYLCSAKTTMRYVNAATIGGICCICHILITNPIGAAASVIRIGPGGLAL